MSSLFPHLRSVPNQHSLNEWMQTCAEFMVEDLAKSGLVPEDMGTYPYPIRIPKQIGLADAAYVIPYYDLSGQPMLNPNTKAEGKMHRKRLRYPDTVRSQDIKKCPKYRGPSTEEVGRLLACAPYIPPSWWASDKKLRFICEGEKKAVALSKRFGVGAMAIGGCSSWSYRRDDNTRVVHPWILEAMAGVERVIIIPDGDVRRPNINREYKGLARGLEVIGARVVEVVNFSLLNPDKLDDWLVAHPSAGAGVLNQWERFDVNDMHENAGDLQSAYDLAMEGREGQSIIPNENNFIRLFEGYPVFKGQIKYNLDKNKVEYVGAGEHYAVDLECLAYFQDVFGINKARIGTINNALAAVASRNTYSPLAEWLMGLASKEGIDEDVLDQWMIDYLGAEDTEYVREVSRKCVIAAVARRLDPGCPVDFMPILKGAQGIGKSGAIRSFFGEDNTLEYIRGVAEGKDALLQNVGIWCHSNEELGNMSNKDKNNLKAQITLRVDSFRAPYEKLNKTHPRRYVMWGSTNDTKFLPEDVSGQRRYAIVEMKGKVDFEGLAAVREDIWAAGVQVYLRGEVDFSNILGATEENEKYVLVSALQEQVEQAVEDYERGGNQVIVYKGWRTWWIKITQIMKATNQEKLTNWDQRKIAEYLVNGGYEWHKKVRIGGKPESNIWLKKCTP